MRKLIRKSMRKSMRKSVRKPIDKSVRKVRTRKKSTDYKKVPCSPGTRHESKNGTCYSSEALVRMRDIWNKRHPDAIITASDPVEIWQSLKNKLGNACSSEACWLKQNFAKGGLPNDILAYTFAPQAPDKWNKKPSTWLNSDDISKVMKHIEYANKDFVFFGPSPIDFDKRLLFGQCVWNDICKIDIPALVKQGKTKLGFIFNIDPHNKPGSHWVAMYIDLDTGNATYMDSYGIEAPKEIIALYERLRSQSAGIGYKLSFNAISRRHQKGESECGMYSLNFIISMLTGELTAEDYEMKRLPDNLMRNLRKKYFS